MADIYPRFGPTMECGIGAAHAIINESKGKLIDQKSGEPLKYNSKRNLLNNYFVAIN